MSENRRVMKSIAWPYEYGYNSYMKTASISETKNQLSALIDRVKRGESILILDRGRPVARLVAASTEGDTTGRIERLEREGAVLRAKRKLEAATFAAPPEVPGGHSVVGLLLEERRSGR